MQYNYIDIEQKWQKKWHDDKAYEVKNDSPKPTCYVLDMFPYPSGAGLHVGHPLGYIASDIYARYKRLKGFNVLHPMGFDAFGLPAEQYAIETGRHPAVTTEKNITRYKQQLNNIGFCYDWSREVKTSDPSYYKWTQWIFLQLFNSWYNPETNKVEPIIKLKNKLLSNAIEAKTVLSHKEIEDTLMQYRLAYRAESYVNWCEALGTVLANDEVVNGVSERGGHAVERRLMSQWFLRITSFAERLLSGLDQVDFPESLKEMQRNWIGKSVGAEINFESAVSSQQSADDESLNTTSLSTLNAQRSTSENLSTSENPLHKIKVFTTRPDTIFGVSFMVLAPEHELVSSITTIEQKEAIETYQKYVSSRSERERLAETKVISGCFTGAYALHPFTQKPLPIWISEYVLAGYGTGAIMAVPSGDERDFAFAQHFNLEIPCIFSKNKNEENSIEVVTDKNAVLINSDFLNGLTFKDASKLAIDKLEEMNIGSRKINYRMRDAGFSRQRYWGEPFPIVYDANGIAIALPEKSLPLELPYLETYSTGPNEKGPLANAEKWMNATEGTRETDTMPGFAGSSWYYLRYMDPHNESEFCDKKISDYWKQVDVYVGGAEHAVGHLLYSRMWCKALCDLGYISFDEPYKKLVNQGMIQGSSRFVYRYLWSGVGAKDFDNTILPPIFISKSIVDGIISNNKSSKKYFYDSIRKILLDLEISFGVFEDEIQNTSLHVDVNIVDGYELDVEAFKKWRPEYANAEFILEDGKYICGEGVEKMSKSKYNVVNPDDIIGQYGTDTFRMYEMFLGPIDVSKPWDTKGIEGVHRFLKKLWRLFFDEQKGILVTDEKATNDELKILHQTIKKVANDIELFAFNTAVSQFMICVNELSKLACNKREILEPLLITLTPFAPHISEELWHQLGNRSSILDAPFPDFNEAYLIENMFTYPVAINGKTRTEIEFALDLSENEIESQVLQNEIVIKWMESKPMKKFIFKQGKMVNVVI